MTETTEDQVKAPVKKEQKTNSNQGYRQFFVLLSLLLLSVISLVYYTKQLTSEQSARLNSRIEKFTSEQQNQLKISSANIEELFQAEKVKMEKIQKNINATLKDSPYKTNDWLMQKARYYLELAGINNTWTNDYATTQSLLEGADNTLKNISSEEITEIRKTIAAEALKVSTANKLDTIKLLSQLHAISTAIQNIQAKPSVNNTSESAVNADENKASASWREHFKNSLAQLNKLIIVRRTTDASKHILSPNYLAAIRENIKLNIQQMQWAVIERNQEVYNISCKQAMENIETSFNLDAAETKAILEKLEQMQEVDLTLAKAKIGGALHALEKLIAGENASDEE